MKCEDCGGEMRWNYFDRKNMCIRCGNESPPSEKQITLEEYIK